MSYEFYKLLHLFGISLLLVGLGILYFVYKSGHQKGRGLALTLHGLGLASIFISGFGLAAKLGFFAQWPNWIHGKLLVWILFGIMIWLFKKNQKLPAINLISVLLIFFFAAYLAIYKI